MARVAARTIGLFNTSSSPRSVRSLSALLRVGSRAQSGAAGVVESPWPPVSIPEETLTEFVWAKCVKFTDMPAITCAVSGRSYTFGEAREYTRRFAWSLLADERLKKGDRVGILLPNIPEYLVAIHGVIEAGLVPTFVNPLYTPDEVARQFQNAEVKCCITIPQLEPIAKAVNPSLRGYTSTIVIGETEHKPDAKILSFQQLIMDAKQAEEPKLSPEDLAVLPYSSGTTGLPKGVILTHKNLISNIVQTDIPDINHFSPTNEETQDVALSMLPFFHIYGFNSVMNTTMRHSVHLVSIPRFIPEDYINALIKYKPRCLFVVPSILIFLATHPAVKAEHLASVDTVLSGAAAATRSLINNFKAKLGRDDVCIRQGFGMTEASPAAILGSLSLKTDKSDSAGFVMPNTQAKIVDIETQQTLGANKSGELLIRGPQIMRGYLNNEEATKEAIDSDKWLHTGDVAYYDEEGFFYIIDRTKELIKVKGNQVSPTELENLIMQIRGVADVAVVGIPDILSGEIPRAFVVCRPDAKVTEEEIIEYVKPKVAKFKHLAGGVKMIDAIPRNPSGKVLRHQLKALCHAEKLPSQ